MWARAPRAPSATMRPPAPSPASTRASPTSPFSPPMAPPASGRWRAAGRGPPGRGGGIGAPAVLEAAGGAARQLPPTDDAPVRGLQLPCRRRWPALEDPLWLPAAGDGACSNLGSGCVGPDRIALNVGTSAALRLVTGAAPRVPWGLWRDRGDARRHLVGGPASEGGHLFPRARR